MCSGTVACDRRAHRERSGRTTPKTVEDEAWWTFWVEDEGDIRHGVSAARRPAPATGVGVLDRSVDVLDAVEPAPARSRRSPRRPGSPSRPRTGMITALQDARVPDARRRRRLRARTAAAHPRDRPPCASSRLRQLARPALEQLARTTGESAQLYVRHGDRRICVDAVESDNELRTIVPIGASLAARQGLGGQGVPRMGSHPPTRTSRTSATSISTTRRRGWADSYGEREPGVASVSAPIFGPNDHLLAAISVSGPQLRLAGPCRPSATGRRSSRPREQVERLLGRAEARYQA